MPFFPQEDSKLRASSLSVRRGGNCPNSLEVLVQLLDHESDISGRDSSPNDVTKNDEITNDISSSTAHKDTDIQLHLISTLPERGSPDCDKILSSFGASKARISFDRCLFRQGHRDAASSYIIRSDQSGTRTLVNYNNLPEMESAEVVELVTSFSPDDEYIFHFEVSVVVLSCSGSGGYNGGRGNFMETQTPLMRT